LPDMPFIITTGRRTSRRTRSFINELAQSILGAQKIPRGKLGLRGLLNVLGKLKVNRIIMVYTWKGNPGKIEFRKFQHGNLVLQPPIIYLSKVKLRREYGFEDRFKAEAVTVGSGAKEEVLRLAGQLSSFVGLPLKKCENGNHRTCIHIAENSRRQINICFVSQPSKTQVGPLLTIRNVVWENLEKTWDVES